MSVCVTLCVDSKGGVDSDSIGMIDGNTLEMDVSVVTPEVMLIGISRV